MLIVVTGATGNIGSATVRALTAAGHQVVGVARRSPVRPGDPAADVESVRWRACDLERDDVGRVLAGADAVVHLAWRMQPMHRPGTTWRANAVGTRRVLAAAREQGVGTVVCASSVAAYSPVDHDDPVDETWATDGTSTAAYCREKAYVERSLDAFEEAVPGCRVVRLRPAFVFQRSAASEQRRIFGGPLARPWLLQQRRLPLVPVPRDLRFQAVHAADVAAAVLAALTSSVRGPLNLAAPGLLDRHDLGDLLGARTVEVPRAAARRALAAAFAARLAPVPADLMHAFLHVPVLDTTRARQELGWTPRHDARDAVAALVDGVRLRAGSTLPPLHP